MSDFRQANSSTAKSGVIRRIRKTKVVATLGPSTDSRESIAHLVTAGADVFRLNFSHGAQAEHGTRLAKLREVERQLRRPIAVIADLQGPKLRIGRFADGAITLSAGQMLRFDLDPAPGDDRRVQLPHPEVFASLEPKQRLLLDDGRVVTRITACGPDYAEAVVMSGSTLSDRKGFNTPDTTLNLSPLTDKDRADLNFALDQEVDWIALSFVQRADDLAEGRRLVAGRAGLMSKIERPQAIEHLDQLIEMSDAIMVARGDLGVELPAEDVPSLQKRIVRRCRLAGKPVIVATQMLESMITAAAPTRAEASDVATAVYDGADAVMLSAETAAGQYPVEAVTMMDRIARRVERDPLYRTILDAAPSRSENTTADAITAAARQVAHTIGAAAIVTYTSSGFTTLRAARERPEVPIMSLTADVRTARRLALCWGVHAVHTRDIAGFQEMINRASRLALREGLASEGQRLVITAGVPFGTPGNTNVLRIAWVAG